jgi:hypothetical protein
MGVRGSTSIGDVANQCRIVCAINLQYLKEMFKSVWTFSIAIDAGNNVGTAYLNLRMRCYVKDTLQNLHLLAIPMRERHTGKYQHGLIVAALDVLAPEWRHQLIGVASDGASTMTGCMQGTCTRLERECHAPIFRIWCGAHCRSSLQYFICPHNDQSNNAFGHYIGTIVPKINNARHNTIHKEQSQRETVMRHNTNNITINSTNGTAF